MSDFSVGYAGNGMFTVTSGGETRTMNIADMDIMLRTEQVEIYDQEIADQYAEIKAANDKRKAYNELLSQMRSAKEAGKTRAGSDSFELSGYEDEGSKTVRGWMDYFGMTGTTTEGSVSSATLDQQWDANIEEVKGLIDEITSDTELMMLRFRQMVDKRGTALQEAKSTMQQDKQLKDRILN